MNEEQRELLWWFDYFTTPDAGLPPRADKLNLSENEARMKIRTILSSPAQPEPTSGEREGALKFIDSVDRYLRSGDGDWDISSHANPEAEIALDTIRALILSAPAPASVTRTELRDWARAMTDVGDYYKNLTSDQMFAASEANENYLRDKLEAKGLKVED